MYFEPSKKTYYRFPSTSSLQDFDTKHYYPDKPYASGENLHFDAQFTNYENTQENPFSN